MVSTRERSLNTVSLNEPNMLIGSSQNGDVAGTRAVAFLVMGIQRHRWKERT